MTLENMQTMDEIMDRVAMDYKSDHEKEYFEVMKSAVDEYKYLESEKVGEDIGYEKALLEWKSKYGEAHRKDFDARKSMQKIKEQLDKAHPASEFTGIPPEGLS